MHVKCRVGFGTPRVPTSVTFVLTDNPCYRTSVKNVSSTLARKNTEHFGRVRV
jgi:hypothetical protein